MVDRVKNLTLEYLTVDDSVTISGNTTIRSRSTPRGFTYEFSPVAVSQTTSTSLTYAHLRNGVITGLNVASGLTYTLPLGISTGSNMVWLGDGTRAQYGHSFQWTMINMSSTTGNLNIVDAVGYTFVGNRELTTNASYSFLIRYTSLNTCITHRGCN